MKVKPGMIRIRYRKDSDGEVGTYTGIENPDQTNETHLGLVIADSTTLQQYKEDYGSYQERKANGQFKKMYRRFIRANIIEQTVVE